MGGATDARVVIAYDLFAFPFGVGLGNVEDRRGEPDQILLDLALILTGGGDDRRGDDFAVIVGLVSMIKNPPRRLGDPGARPGAKFDGFERAFGRFVFTNQPDRQIDRVKDLDRAHDDRYERILTRPRDPQLPPPARGRRPSRGRDSNSTAPAAP